VRAFRLYKHLRRRHLRWTGMRVGFRDLTAWSFLMASAHGAGLMLVPVFLRHSSARPEAHAHGTHADQSTMSGSVTVLGDLVAVGIHTLAMFAVIGAVAVLVYEKLGVVILKRTWFNVDLLPPSTHRRIRPA
jgi:hypothetical protein